MGASWYFCTMENVFDGLNLLAPGDPRRMGVHPVEGGWNVVVFSRHASHLALSVFERDASGGYREAARYRLVHRDGVVWHGFLPSDADTLVYGFRADGPSPDGLSDVGLGHLRGASERAKPFFFEPSKLLLDPYAPELVRAPVWHDALYHARIVGGDREMPDSGPYAPLGQVRRQGLEGSAPPRIPQRPWTDTVIYEAHVRGMTQLLQDVPADLRGTYLGFCHDRVIEHLSSLGVTTVQLMPIFAFLQDHRLVEQGLTQYWGYNPLSFFAPEPRYASDPQRAAAEVRQMVGRLHEAGIEVVLDVVFNHTAEGSHLGPTLSWRGLDAASYYIHAEDAPTELWDVTGTGNTVNVYEPMVLRMVMDALRHWVTEYGIDGFRFDLAPALCRTPRQMDMRAPFLQAMAQDPILGGVKLIAEPWDIGPDGYQLGRFGAPWRELNGAYRDVVRQYWMGHVRLGDVTTRISGSRDLFPGQHTRGLRSVNFITAHDGFTLADLVSYEHKRNEANGEQNRDGHEPNYGWNHGVEGPSVDPAIQDARGQTQRALLATLLLSDGIPFLLGGDELGRTQQGNNNAYCQDNALSWFDWDGAKGELQAWIADLISLRSKLGSHGLMSLYREAIRRETLHWYHPSAQPIMGGDWDASGQVPFAASIKGQADWVILLFNPSLEPCRFDLSMVPNGVPRRLRWGPTGRCDRPCDQQYTAAPRTVQLIAVGDQTAR